MGEVEKKPEDAPLPCPADRPGADVVIFDGGCDLCSAQARRLVWWDCQHRLAYLSMHDPEVERRWPDLPRERLEREMCIIDNKGRRYWGPEAIGYLTLRLRRLWWAAPLLNFPGAMWVWRPIYRWVARNQSGNAECGLRDAE